MKKVAQFLLLVSLLVTGCVNNNKESSIVINNANVSQLQMINAYLMDTEMTIQQINNVKIGVIDFNIDFSSPNLNIMNSDLRKLEIESDRGDYHGTSVVSLLSAERSGVDSYNGLLPGANIYFYGMQDLNIESLVNCLEEAIEDNVDVINISLSTYKDSPTLKSIIEKAAKKGIIIIASAGNNSTDTLTYPSSYPSVISVGALDETYDLLSSSNYNDHTDVVAPGYSAKTLNEMVVLNATSEATVYVTCLTILLKARHPKYSTEQVKEEIKSNSTSFTTNWNGKIRKVYLIDFRKTLDL